MSSPPTALMFDKEATVRVAAGQVSTDLGGEIAIVHIESGRYFALDDVGSRVWEVISEPKTVGAILQVLLEEYEVAPERCARDLDALLRGLAERGLVEIPGNRHG